MVSRKTNAEFAQSDKVFLKACELAGLPKAKRKDGEFFSLARQAGKYRRGKGLAYAHRREAQRAIAKEG